MTKAAPGVVGRHDVVTHSYEAEIEDEYRYCVVLDLMKWLELPHDKGDSWKVEWNPEKGADE